VNSSAEIRPEDRRKMGHSILKWLKVVENDQVLKMKIGGEEANSRGEWAYHKKGCRA
jgi:hypothetical protein